MEARELSGLHIGRRIRIVKTVHYFDNGTRTTKEYAEDTEPITMITHKKNGQVLVRHGKNNRQPLLRGNYPVELLPED
jgi:hypothetical protein